MKLVFVLAVVSLSTASTIPRSQRIIGGTATTINQYPMAAAILVSTDLANYAHRCGGTIINNRSVLTAGHCLLYLTTAQVRIRLASSYANSGGQIFNAAELIIHPFENVVTDSDVAIFRSSTFFVFSAVLSSSNIPGPSYIVPDNAPLLAIGWGRTATGEKTEQLQHVQVNAISNEVCRSRYPATIPILDSHICSGILNVGGGNPCEGDGGGPLFHFNTIVGIASYSLGCGDDYYPGVNTKVSSYTSWIVANA